MSDQMMSLAEIMAHPSGKFFIELTGIASDEAMAEFCERQIDAIFRIMEENPKIYQGFSEDQLTITIVNMLKSKEINAEHDTMRGGHTDIIIKVNKFTWAAEAKVFENGRFAWLLKGFLQLTTRYMTARDQHAALLIYTFLPESALIMKKWETSMGVHKNISRVWKCTYCAFSFFTSCPNPRSGAEMRIRHAILSLYFNPEA